MRLIKPSYEIIPQQEGIEGVYKQVELAGRVCYKSEDKITETSSKEFVDRMIKSGHGAMLEHGTIYLFFAFHKLTDTVKSILNRYENKYSRINIIDKEDNHEVFITTNLRYIIENNLQQDVEDFGSGNIANDEHEKRISVRFICDRGVSHEFVRHRVFSFAQESTRFCNYSKDKFGNELTFIIPSWYKYFEGGKKEYAGSAEYNYDETLQYIEQSYFNLLELGWSAQQARAILPNSIKTELIMTGFESDWKEFFKLRTAGSAHPQARELTIPLEKELF